MKKYVGLAGAQGQVLYRAVVLGKKKVAVQRCRVEDPQSEINRFQLVRREYIAHLQKLYEQTLRSLGENAAKIFKAYEMIAMDDFFFKKPLKMVQEESVNADYAVEMEKQRVSEKFAAMDDPYMKERATDIRNVCDELVRRLNGVAGDDDLPCGGEPFLVVAEDLTPEDTVRIDKSSLGGFVTERGGVTSHAVILAKTLGIPAVVGVSGLLGEVRDGQMLYINGGDGTVVIEPDEAFLQTFLEDRAKAEDRKKRYEHLARQRAVTEDGREISVCVNSGDADSIHSFDAQECDGVGLFRTEFLFMDQRDYPDEELQFAVYREIAQKAAGKEVIVRTLDIGGDKQLDYMNIEREDNPFLGYRAIRICLDRKEIFLTQLRAILRASAYGAVKIMFPMIVTLEELIQAKALVGQAKEELREEGIAFQEKIPVGIMVETPGAVMISDILAHHTDFFSIGTNDLIQYVTATDRMNHKVQYLYDPCNLSVLRAVHTVIQNGHKAGIPVGMCGEMASDERLVPLLLGMGLDEFSVVPSQVGRIKYMIGRLHFARLEKWAGEVMQSQSIQALKECLSNMEVE